MRRSIPHILFLASLAFVFLPSAGIAVEDPFCSEEFCRDLPPEHPCLCPHCPVWVECQERFTCTFESPLAGGLDALTTTGPAAAGSEAGLASTLAGEAEAAQPALDGKDLFETMERPRPDPEGDAR